LGLLIWISFGLKDWAQRSQFAEQRGQKSGDLCIEGWRQRTPVLRAAQICLCFVTASNKLLHLLVLPRNRNIQCCFLFSYYIYTLDYKRKKSWLANLQSKGARLVAIFALKVGDNELEHAVLRAA